MYSFADTVSPVEEEDAGEDETDGGQNKFRDHLLLVSVCVFL